MQVGFLSFTDLLGEGQEQPRNVWAAQLNSRVGSRFFPSLLWRTVLHQVQAGLSTVLSHSGDHLLGHTPACPGRISVVISGSFLPSVFSPFVRLFLLHPPLHWVGVASNSEETPFWGELEQQLNPGPFRGFGEKSLFVSVFLFVHLFLPTGS